MSPESQDETDHPTRATVADFGATLAAGFLVVSSAMNFLQGGSAIANDDLYAAGTEYLYKLDMTVWGTIHLILGVVGIVVGVGIFMRASWAQVSGMIVAGLVILTNFAFLPHYPLWSIVIIAFNGFAIWALSVQLRGYDY